MADFARSAVTAVLGPTNTGKTHLAVERMCAHSSGMIGFPLRLLAREVYDRVVAIKGAHQVALITGEEKICPPGARWFLCTAESMPVLSGRPSRPAEGPMDRDFAFVAIDEAQLGSDPERGHVFTDRLLRARGREETMILGSETLRPLVAALVPDAEIITRPRFSTLSYAGSAKLSRLPKRSAIVAFSQEEVYAVAETLRRLRGGAAVVMGALSPRTRNAQVAMFQAGEVDYLVATDAIGMGLNMDVAHVAFASLRKFDGHRQRRLTVPEMAQIAGRAGRHQRDGSFGSLGGQEGGSGFTPEEIERIEEHRFPPLEYLYWRDGAPPMDSLSALINALEAKPSDPLLRPAPEAIDLAILKRLADDPLVIERARGRARVARLWAACSLPDFRKVGVEHHGRLVLRLYKWLSEGSGHIPRDWFGQELAKLDTVQGDIATLSGRIAAARTFSYIAHRADWLSDPAEMAERTRALEEKLSDALHQSLTQRFVDRRTAVLLREIGLDASQVPVELEEDGAVLVDGERIGTLHGFHFKVDADVRHGDRKILLAAAERRLGTILSAKVDALLAAPAHAFHLLDFEQGPVAIACKDMAIARLHPGPTLLSPDIRIDRGLASLTADQQRRILTRMKDWLPGQVEAHLRPLLILTEKAGEKETPPPLRAILAPLIDAGGILPRAGIDDAVRLLDKGQRQMLRKLGVTIGSSDLFHPALLKPKATALRLALIAARAGTAPQPQPRPGLTLIENPARGEQEGLRQAGFRQFGTQFLRIDLVERIARAAHDAQRSNTPFDQDNALIVSLGLSEDGFNRLMRAAGFRPQPKKEGEHHGWTFHGRRRPRREASAPRPGNAFAALAGLTERKG